MNARARQATVKARRAMRRCRLLTKRTLCCSRKRWAPPASLGGGKMRLASSDVILHFLSKSWNHALTRFPGEDRVHERRDLHNAVGEGEQQEQQRQKQQRHGARIVGRRMGIDEMVEQTSHNVDVG